MSILADLISGVLSDTLIVQFARTKNKAFLIGFGILTALASIALLGYQYSLPPVQITNYSTKEIEYSVATSNSKDGRVTLRSEPADYSIPDHIWQNEHSREYIVGTLNKSRKATIWVGSPSSREILGINTSDLAISPEAALEWENKNTRSGVWVCWTFFLCGLGIIFLATRYY